MTNLEIAEKYLIFKVVAGSRAYGTDTETSDTDIRGIFLLPNEYRLGNNYFEQASDETNDVVYYELNRFVDLLILNNPNIVEILNTPADKILLMDDKVLPLYENRNLFLTKQIKNSFGGYALSQIRKARGLNKKIVNPIAKKKKSVLDFCYIFEKENGYMVQARKWLKKNLMQQEYVGLAEMPNGIQLYKLYYDWTEGSRGFKGICLDDSHDVRHSAIPKGYPLEAFLYFNLNGYSTYCREYKEYWEWVDKRNPHRYNDNISHNQNYDGKNMMHCLRLLDVAIEVGKGMGVVVKRPNRDFLLSVKKGQLTYDAIMQMIEDKKAELERVYQECTLPDAVSSEFANEIILKIRKNDK